MYLFIGKVIVLFGVFKIMFFVLCFVVVVYGVWYEVVSLCGMGVVIV